MGGRNNAVVFLLIYGGRRWIGTWRDFFDVVWHRPEDVRSPPMQQQANFSTVQRQIMKTMMVCFHTTLTDALQNETSFLPPRLRLREKVLKFVTRMLTAPPQHMVCPKYERWRDRMRKAVGVGGMKMEKLFGNSKRIIRDTVEFIESTERFEF
jgi:hypothetical protein